MVLRNIGFCAFALSCLPTAASPTGGHPATRVLTSAAQVIALSPQEANRRLPAAIRAIVTINRTPRGDLFLQDGSAAVYIKASSVSHAGLQPGDLVEVSGVTHACSYVPCIVPHSFTRLQHPGLPPPRQVRTMDLLNGTYSNTLVEITGKVGALRKSEQAGGWEFTITDADGAVPVVAECGQDISALAGSTVKVRALCLDLFNLFRQFRGPQLLVDDLSRIQLVRPFDFSAIPASSIPSLRTYKAGAPMLGFVRVSGTTTLCDGVRGTYVQDGDRAILVEGVTLGDCRIGQRAEAAGSPEVSGSGGIVLRSGVLRPLASGEFTAPVENVDTSALLHSDEAPALYENRLVSLRGRLIDTLQGPAEDRLILSGDQVVFTASVPHGSMKGMPLPGSMLSVTGVLEVNWDPHRRAPLALSVLTRGRSDLELVAAPPFLDRLPRSSLIAAAVILAGAAALFARLH